jgi:hypothetical protein
MFGELSGQSKTQGASPLLAPIDGDIRDEIVRSGSHPFILVRLPQAPPRFVVCQTQNDIAEFVDTLSRLPGLGTNTLFRGIERALQLETYEAADALFLWVEGTDADFAEKVYLGVPEGLECPAYYGYPVLERVLHGQQGSAEERLELLVNIFEAYDRTDGNDAMRFALLESLALALSRALGARGRFTQALQFVERGLSYLPRSIHLKTASHALNLKVHGEPLHERLEKFVGADSGHLKQFVCPVPFGRMQISHTGDVLLCCGHWLPTVVGNFMKGSIDDVLNSVKARKIRESVTDGSYKYCNHLECAVMNQGHLRQRELLTDPHITQAIASGRYEVDGVDDLMFALDQTCNLSCPSCRTDRITEKVSEAADKTRATEEKLYPLLPTVKVLHINSAGELFASKPSRRVLELIDDQLCPDLILKIISNGTLFNEKEWNRYPGIHNKVFTVRISTDAASKSTFEKLRRLGKYETFIDNMRFVGGLRQDGKIGMLMFSFTYQLDNFREMPDFIAFTKSMHGDFALFERLQNLGAFSEEEYRRKSVHYPGHPLYNEFLQVISDPIFNDRRCVAHDFDFPGRQGPSNEEMLLSEATLGEWEMARMEFIKRRKIGTMPSAS